MNSEAGFLNLLKPPGMTSHDVVYQVRRLLPRKTKVGHLGTLDPSATGVLPVAVAGATRLIPLLPDLGPLMKAYLAEIQLGLRTDSDDLDGEVLERHSLDLLGPRTEDDWRRALAPFRGAISQVPPQVSAIRKDGQRAYALARKGIAVELAARPVEVARCDFLSYHTESGRLRFFLVCSTGTYVRSIARDLGQNLGVGAALAFLVRTQSGPFGLEQAVTLERLRADGVVCHLLPCGFPFAELPYRDRALSQKGETLRGDFHTGQRYLTPDGLLLGTEEFGVAKVEALF